MSSLLAFTNPVLTKERFITNLKLYLKTRPIKTTNLSSNGYYSIIIINSLVKTASKKDLIICSEGIKMPITVMSFQEAIFEKLPSKAAEKWPLKFFEAIQPNSNTELVFHKIIPRALRELIKPHAGMWASLIERAAIGWETNWKDEMPHKLYFDADRELEKTDAMLTAMEEKDTSGYVNYWSRASSACYLIVKLTIKDYFNAHASMIKIFNSLFEFYPASRFSVSLGNILCEELAKLPPEKEETRS